MSALTVNLPNPAYQKIKELAERCNISVNQFIESAATEKMTSMAAFDSLKAGAAQGDRADFLRYLGMVPDVAAEAGDAA